MWDIFIPNGKVYTHTLSPNRTLAGLAIRGDGAFSLNTNESTHFKHKDFVIIQSEQDGEIIIKAIDKDLRIFLIEIPTEVDYPLYRKSG
jgi:quercetin 2,3-dioxygenase